MGAELAYELLVRPIIPHSFKLMLLKLYSNSVPRAD